ncbi:EamA family transporter [Lacinutrix salivirga]
MIYLLLSILASTLIYIVFKLLGKYKINTLQAIVFNYLTACAIGLFMYKGTTNISEIASKSWFFGAFALGFLFIAIFNVMALTAQRNGLTVTSVASKMSVVIPIVFGLYAYNESLGWQKGVGILLALIAVYLTSVKSKTEPLQLKGLWLPVLLFFGSGVIDASIKYIETNYVADNGIPLFSATIFGIAACVGSAMICIQAFKNKFTFDYRSIFGGILLGMVNYCSIYMILKALQHEGFESSTIFTINNVAIVVLSTIIGLIAFKEKLLTKNWIGIGIAIVSIILVTLS